MFARTNVQPQYHNTFLMYLVWTFYWIRQETYLIQTTLIQNYSDSVLLELTSYYITTTHFLYKYEHLLPDSVSGNLFNTNNSDWLRCDSVLLELMSHYSATTDFRCVLCELVIGFVWKHTQFKQEFFRITQMRLSFARTNVPLQHHYTFSIYLVWTSLTGFSIKKPIQYKQFRLTQMWFSFATISVL